MEKMNLDNLCFRFFQSIYGELLDSQDVELVKKVYSRIADYNDSYMTACKAEVLRIAKVREREKYFKKRSHTHGA